MNSITDFTTFKNMLTELSNSVKTYSSVEEYLSTVSANSSYIIGSNALELPPEMGGEIVQFQPKLTGGSELSTVINDLARNTETGEITSTVAGGLFSSVIAPVVFTVLAGVGVAVASKKIEDIAYNAMKRITGRTDLTRSEALSMSLPVGIISPTGSIVAGPLSLALSQKYMEHIVNAAQEEGVFDVEYNVDIPETTGVYTLNSISLSEYEAYLENRIDAFCVHASRPVGSATYIKNAYKMYKRTLAINNIDINEYQFYYFDIGVDGNGRVQAFFNILKTNLPAFTVSVTNIPATGIYAQYANSFQYRVHQLTSRIEGRYIIDFNDEVNPREFSVQEVVQETDNFTSYDGFYSHQILRTPYVRGDSYITIEAPEDVEIIGSIPPTTGEINLDELYPEWNTKTFGGINYGKEYQTNKYRELCAELLLRYDEYASLEKPIETNPQVGTITTPLEQPLMNNMPEILAQTNPLSAGASAPSSPPSAPPFEPTVQTTTPTPVVPPLGNSNGGKLFTVYNPTQTELDNASRTLWQSNIIEQIKTLFQNPLDGVIGLSVIFCTPSTNGRNNIYFGNVNSGVASDVVSEQYKTISCGQVTVPELFGNATDYAPYTSISIYLPFIGFRELNVDDVMGGIINVKYKVDVYTGTCIALIEVTRDNVTQMLYTFEGNCSFELPLTGADRNRLLSSVGSSILGYTLGGTTGGLISAISSMGNYKQPVSRVGSFTGNAGAMSIKIPYIVINRNRPYNANNYEELYGFPSNERVLLSSLSGFTRIKDVHVEGFICTKEEKSLIEDALKNGIII